MTIFCLLLVACTPAADLMQPESVPTQPSAQSPTQDVFLPIVGEPDGPENPESTHAGDSCVSEQPNVIGQSIDEEFAGADYAQIMTWFCAGAAFEDIIVALQTEELVEVPAEELLELVAEGFTWEEIWDAVGLN